MTLIAYTLDNDIAVLRLNRPEKRNALSDAMIEELSSCVERASKEAKVAVIHGSGDHFSAGLDLGEHSEKTMMEGIAGSRSWHRVFSRLQRGEIPYIAALHGAVVGGGLELAANAHIRVAAKGTHFALPEGQRGIFLGGGGSVNITRLVGVNRVTDMMLTGRVYNAEEFGRLGIVNYLEDDADGALNRAMELAGRIKENAPLSNYITINGLQRIHDSGYDEGLFFESMVASMTQSTPEAAERLRAFLEKRAARLNIPTKGDGEKS